MVRHYFTKAHKRLWSCVVTGLKHDTIKFQEFFCVCNLFDLSLSLSLQLLSLFFLYFYYTTMIIYILYYLVFKILSSFVRDSSYHNMYYKGCGLLCAHKKSFNTAIPVRSLGPYMYVHYCTCIVHILVSTYLFLLTSFFDCLSFCGLFLKHPYKRFFPFYILYFYQSRFLSHHGATCVEVLPPC